LRAVLLTRIAAVPGLESLVGDAESLVQLLSGRPLARMPMRVTVR
jgi:hypothetical protein